MRPPFGTRANSATARSRSRRSRKLIGVVCIPSVAAAVWMALHCPMPAVVVELRATATRVTRGANSLSSSNHFPPMPYSKLVKPVAFPPGLAKASTKPAPTGSGTIVNTIGIVRVACNAGPVAEAPAAMMTSGADAINSAAWRRIVSPPPPAQRVSIRTLRRSVQPSCCKPCRKATISEGYSESSGVAGNSTPTRGRRSRCCARAARGTATAAPMSVMNSRRFMFGPQKAS